MARKESGMSISTPPLFIRSNYNYWKSCMKIFLSVYDPKVYNAIVDGYTQLEKAQNELIPTEADAYKFNFSTLNAIATGLALNEFRRIDHLKMAKEA